MDLFGIQEHDARHDQVEQQLRSLLEQVAQLTIELGEARGDIARLQDELGSKVGVPDVDAESLDAGVADARVKLTAAQEASTEAWSEIYPQLTASLAKVRAAIDDAGSKDEE